MAELPENIIRTILNLMVRLAKLINQAAATGLSVFWKQRKLNKKQFLCLDIDQLYTKW